MALATLAVSKALEGVAAAKDYLAKAAMELKERVPALSAMREQLLPTMACKVSAVGISRAWRGSATRKVTVRAYLELAVVQTAQE
jgi:hypothetical protein